MAFAADANSRGSTIRSAWRFPRFDRYKRANDGVGGQKPSIALSELTRSRPEAPSIFFLDDVLSVIWVSGQHFAGSRARPRLPRTYAGYTGAGRVAGMCFSATASFSAASITAVIGIATLRQVKHPRELLLAAMPLLFAVQQAIEGALWVSLPAGSDDGRCAFPLFFWFLPKSCGQPTSRPRCF